MNRIKNKYINTKNNFISSFIKNGYEYRIYMAKDIITIEKEDTKSEKFYIKSYKIN